MASPLIELSTNGAIAIVSFNNPPRGYMNAAQVDELSSLLDKVESDSEAKVVIFTGAVPDVFVRHYDVAEIVAIGKAIQKAGRSADYLMDTAKSGNAVSNLFDRVDRFSKPTIAAINGFAQGGGFEFALCCDIRIAVAGGYRIGLPETNIGIFPGAGGTERLPRLIGEAKALELILRGRTVGPDEAFRLGMVHEVVEDSALARSIEIARELADMPTAGLTAAKKLVKGTADRNLSEACIEARGMFSRVIGFDDEAMRAMQKFLDEGEDINRKSNHT